MQLTKEQKAEVERWVKEGCGLSEVQKRLSKEFKISTTFMEVRLLVLDLGLEVENKPSRFTPPTPPPVIDGEPEALPADGEADDGLSGAAPAPAGAVTVNLDRVTRPGAVVSGTVRFSDGVSATWYLDQMGRLALSAGKAGYSPSPEDVQAFQQELRNALQKRGY